MKLSKCLVAAALYTSCLFAAGGIQASEQQVALLRASFPEHRFVMVSVTIVDRVDTEGRPIKTRRDKIRVEVPPRTMWQWYHLVFQHTTFENLNERLPSIQQRISADLASLDLLSGSQSSVKQAELTRFWLKHTLREYIERWQLAAAGTQ